MNCWIITKNNKPLNLKDVPVIPISELRENLIKKIKNHLRVIAFFGKKELEQIKLYIILADDINSDILISSSIFNKNDKYPAITPQIPSLHKFEREFYEEFGIEPIGHPWLKPIRYSKDRFDKSQKIENYPFFVMDGTEIHEVAVGPVHAGIIEPGHFRFMCNGEKIYDLEIQLGYQHRNIEQLFLKNQKFSLHLAESIVGDTVIGHSLAYSNAIEALLNLEISKKAALIRIIALEFERIAVHIGDLSAIFNDIAYIMGNAVFGATRTLVINTLLEITGSRFGRGLIKAGGVSFDIDSEMAKKLENMLAKITKDVERMTETMFSSASVLSRLEKTGTLNKEKAFELGIVGMAARASGIGLDARIDHPCEVYKNLNLTKIIKESGDVYARTSIRCKEIFQSAEIIRILLSEIAGYEDEQLLFKINSSLNPNNIVVSIVEGWRGEIVHTVITDNKGELSRYKIKDPSFNNWFGLAVAVRNNGISDFPLCNKSFNLSYCGNDL